MSEQFELKPCPFCGCSARINAWSFGRWTVTCRGSHCGIMTPMFIRKDEAVKAWNRRAGEEK